MIDTHHKFYQYMYTKYHNTKQIYTYSLVQKLFTNNNGTPQWLLRRNSQPNSKHNIIMTINISINYRLRHFFRCSVCIHNKIELSTRYTFVCSAKQMLHSVNSKAEWNECHTLYNNKI